MCTLPAALPRMGKTTATSQIIEFNIPRKIFGVYLMCVPPEKQFTFQGFAPHFYFLWILNLELIHKLAMNLDQLAPDNNGASKMNQSEIVLRFLFKANKQLAKTVKKGMSDFDHPVSSLEVLIALDFFALLTSGTDMGSVMMLLNGLGTACITSIQSKILRIVLTDGWPGNDDVIQCLFQEFDVMRVCT